MTLHIILPLMFTFDFILFYEHGKLKWYYPIMSAIFPLLYAAFVYIHAAIYKFDSSIYYPGRKDPFIYPYFFLNLDKYGVAGVIRNILIILVVFVVFGYVIFLVDRLFNRDKHVHRS
ncbi:MAG: Pr6Pr family membrane protein, partial [Lachnospiraceae bacterium]|nr:Pr6Pr family membrane protein [Lachnospiraceae bacterium]